VAEDPVETNVRQLVGQAFGDSPAVHVVQESLIILGWVANWKPLETFLYDWWPERRRLGLLRRLARARIVVVGGARSDSPPRP
jgi:hypothetical protein